MENIEEFESKVPILDVELHTPKSPDENNQQEYVITLHNLDDLDDFYNDMETDGGSLYIPGRAIPVDNRRPLSRNTHYRLTEDEALLIKNDPRVLSIELSLEEKGQKVIPSWTQYSDSWSKGTATAIGGKNWGLYYSVNGNDVPGVSYWGWEATPDITATVVTTTSGKNVDVVICDGHLNPAHPQFAKNTDGTGGSRAIQKNWYADNLQVTGGSAETYTYTYTTSDDDHGCHVGGITAGNTQGWARDANIYNISPFAVNPTESLLDYIKYWHVNKPINPATGRQNPTVINCSWGFTSQIRLGIGTSTASTGYTRWVRFRGKLYHTTNWRPYDFGYPAVPTTPLFLTAQDSTLIDNSPNTYTISNTTNVVSVNTTIPFANTYSWQFNGTQYVTVSSADLAFDSGSFTVDFWINFDNLPGTASNGRMTIFSTNSTGYFNLSFSNTQIIITDTTNQSAYTFNYSVSVDTWYHIAIVRNGSSTVDCYVNGTIGTSVSYSSVLTSPTVLTIGKNASTDEQHFSGFISNLRFIKQPVYTQSFSLPSNELLAPTGGATNGVGFYIVKIGLFWVIYNQARVSSVEADVTDLMNLGVKVIFAAGNEYSYVASPTADPTDRYNDYVITNLYELFYPKRGGVGAVTGCMCVGAVSSMSDVRKAVYSNAGTRIDIWAPGSAIQSSINNASGATVVDARNNAYVEEKLDGTSMAAPQVTGIIACLSETYPNLTQAEAVAYIKNKAFKNALLEFIAGNGADIFPIDNYQPGVNLNPGGGTRDILRYHNERSFDGNTFPKINNKLRPSNTTGGVMFPRPRIRLR